ncbi:hypothetical protein C6P46_001521 [Rhodotorula mucilaginosa]|uniref:CFEM domain-containing protein n=1 Tax=Rhodotorula mucilaginosa TaxID=5537 RepID=A0A9P7B275_RHOMI|nr:hypothetical protein C6P46_001521 [Rhodotorula mucilaginosa]TKA51817.1 hypothetical protein B0A53_05169 [Rhodotorula sp. CCFEE 5036]
MLRLAVAYAVAAYLSVLALAQDSSAPVCATSCFATKITEAGYLAPSVSATDLAALCETASFTQAYYNCMSYHCTPDEYQRGVVLGQVVCASVGAAIPSAGITGSAAAVLATASSIPVATGTQVSAAASQFSTFLGDISAVVGSTPVTSAYNTPSPISAGAATASAGASSGSAGAAAAASTGQTSGADSISPSRLAAAALCGFAIPLTLAWTLLYV